MRFQKGNCKLSKICEKIFFKSIKVHQEVISTIKFIFDHHWMNNNKI